MKTPEQRFYDLIEYDRLNGRVGDIGWALNRASYEDLLHIGNRIASRLDMKLITAAELEAARYRQENWLLWWSR